MSCSFEAKETRVPDGNEVALGFDPTDAPTTRRRSGDPRSFAAPLSARHPSLQGAHRFIAPVVTGKEDPPYLAGYLTQPSVAPGDPLSVHVATRSSADCFVDVYRVTGCADVLFTPRLRHVERLGQVSPVRYPALAGGRKLSPGNADADGCRWPGHTLLSAVPESWESGMYIVQFTAAEEPTGEASPLLGQDAVMIVRPARPGAETPLLCQVNLATWLAYHMWDNRSLYMGRAADGMRYDELRASRASAHRPGLGLGLPNETLLTPSPPKAAYAFALVDWLERKGIDVDFCTGLDVGSGAMPLSEYQALLTVGHDEYWTADQRRRVQEFRRAGGHTVFLGGNLAYWEIRPSDDDTAIECYKNSGGGWWSATSATGTPEEPLDPVAYPAAQPGVGLITSEVWRSKPAATVPLTGVYMVTTRPGADELVHAGCAWWWEELGGPTRPAVGFTVTSPDHWVFEGTGLRAGDEFGAELRLIGHEADGLELDFDASPPQLTMADGALPGTELLAYADCRDWGEPDYSAWPPITVPGRRLSCCAFGGSATMIHQQSEGEGMLFAAPLTDWVFALVPSIDWSQHRDLDPLVRPPHDVVEAVTLNVIRRCMGD